MKSKNTAIVCHSLPSCSADQAILPFRVRDTGIGDSRQKQLAIFEGFSQGPRLGALFRRNVVGGVAISSKLLGMMGGEIHLEKRAGQPASNVLSTLRCAWAWLGEPEKEPS